MDILKSFEEIDTILTSKDKKFALAESKSAEIYKALKEHTLVFFNFINLENFVFICSVDYKVLRNTWSSYQKTKYYNHNPYESFITVYLVLIKHFNNFIESDNERKWQKCKDRFLKDIYNSNDEFHVIYLIIIKNLYLILNSINEYQFHLSTLIQGIKNSSNYKNEYSKDVFEFLNKI